MSNATTTPITKAKAIAEVAALIESDPDFSILTASAESRLTEFFLKNKLMGTKHITKQVYDAVCDVMDDLND